MVGRIKILAMTVAAVVEIEMLYATTYSLSAVSHLLTVADFYSRLAALRIFEIAYRLYSLPL